MTLPNYARVFSDISTMNSFPRAKGIIPPALEIVKHFVYNFLRDLEGVQRAYESSKNRLVKEVLRLTLFMVEYGLYINEEELEAMIDPLVCLLDGTTDIVLERGDFQTAAIQATGFGRGRTKMFSEVNKEADRQRQMERFESKDGNALIMSCKAKVCHILLAIINIRQDMKLSNFLLSFRDNSSHSRSLSDTPTSSAKHSRYESSDQMLPFNSAKKQSKSKNMAKIKPEHVERRGPSAWLNDILEDSTLEIQECTTKNFVAVLMDLLLYKHSDLANSCFTLMLQYFTQRHSLLTALLNVQLLENEESIHALSSLNEQLAILKTHADNAEFWLGRQYELGFTNPRVLEQYATDSLTLSVHQHASEILSGMAKLCFKELAPPLEGQADDEPDFERTVWKSDSEASRSFEFENRGTSLSKLVTMSTKASEIDPEIFTFSEMPSRSFQRLLRNLNVFEPVLELIKFTCIQQFYSETRHQLVLRFCYVFLAKFCRNNSQNQELLSHYSEHFIAAMPNTVFAMTLVREIYQNNATLCLKLPIKYIRLLAKAIGDTPLSPKKCGIIRTLHIFIRVNGKLLRRNQIEVMSQLSSYELAHFKGIYDTADAMAELQRMNTGVIRQYVMHTSKTGLQGIAVPLEIQYFVEMLQIMSLCSEEKNAQAEQTCQYLISMAKLMELMAASSLFWPLKHALMQFFYEVYLNVEDSVQEDDAVIWVIIRDLVSDLAYIFDNYTHSGQQFSPSVEHVRFSLMDRELDLVQSALNYVYEAVIPSLRQIFLKRGAHIPQEWNSEVLQSLVAHVCDFHRISPKIEFSRLSCDFIILMSEVPRLQAYLDGVSIPDIISSREALNRVIKTGPRATISMEEGQKGAELLKIVKELMDSDEVQEGVDLEFSEIVRSFTNSDRLTEQAFGAEFRIESRTLFRALVFLLDINNINLEDSLTERGLRLLRKCVEVEVRDQRGAAADWDTDKWINFEEAVSKQQNLLAEVGCVQLICNLFPAKKETDIRVECVLLAVAILLGGNRAVQSTFMACFQDDKDNSFLIEVQQVLAKNFETTRAEEMSKLHSLQKELSEKSILTSVHTEVEESSEEEYQIVEDADAEAADDHILNKEHHTPYGQVVNILRFLQLLCEGHYGEMQDHLREQWLDGVLHGKSIDFILIISGYLGVYTKMLRLDNIKLGFQLLDTLTEVVQGPCRGNQRLLSQPKSIDQCRDLLTSLKHSSDQEIRGFRVAAQEHISTLKSKTVNFLLSLLEGDADIEITKQISESLDVKRCKERMLDVFKNFVAELGLDFNSSVLSAVDRNLSRESFEGAIEEGFNLYILLSKLADDYSPAREYISDKSFEKDEELLAFTFFKQHTARIEVVIDGRLQRTYFPIQPICAYISSESKDRLMATVNRDSASSKVSEMLAMAEDLIEEMEHNYNLARKRFVITSDGVAFLRKVGSILAFAINYIMLFNYDFSNESKNELTKSYHKAISILAAIIFSNSILVLIIWCVLKAKLTILKGWKVRTFENKSLPPVAVPPDTPVEDLPVKKTIEVLFRHGPDAVIFRQDGERNFGNLTTLLVYWSMCCKMVLSKGTFQYFCVYSIVIAMGWWDVFFYSFLLLDAMYMFPTLTNVLNALTVGANQIIMTSLLMLVLIYIWALWGFYIDPTMFYDGTIGTFGESLCQSLWECFLTTMNNGLRLTGGIGDILIKVPWDNKSKYYNKWFYQLTYFLVVILIVLNIFLGIIVSTFAQLRDEKKNRQDDTENRCFICNIDRQTFDKDGAGFENHIHNDHYLWNYINYKVHLKEKDQTEYTGVESYISELIKEDNISWMPMHRALILGQEAEDKKAIEAFIEKLEDLSTSFKSFGTAMNAKAQ